MKKIGKVLLVSTGILVGTNSIPLNYIGMEKTEASTAVVTWKVTYQTTSNLALREQAGSTYKSLVTIPKGAIVTSSAKLGTWIKLSYTYEVNGVNTTKTGWVSAAYLKEYYKYSPISRTYLFTNKTTKLYTTPDTKKPYAYSIAVNNGFGSTQMVVNSVGQTWYRIYLNNKTYYVNSVDVVKNTFSNFEQTKYSATINTSLYQFYGTSFTKLVAIPQNTVVTTSSRIGNFYAVSYGGKTGYINIADFAKYYEVKIEDTALTYYITNKQTNLYTTADPNKQVVTSIGTNNGFTSTQKVTDLEGQIWYRVSYNGQYAYINSNDMTASSQASVTQANYKATKATYVYESFGTAFKQLSPISPGTVVLVNKKVGDFYNVSYKGIKGYINIKDFTPDTTTVTKLSNVTYVTTADLNVRVTYDASSDQVTTIPNAEIVTASEKLSNGWYKVTYNGKTGYVSGSYLKQVTTGDPITTRDSYQFLDLRTQSPVTAAQINDYIANYVNTKGKKSVLTGQGQLFIDAGKQYGVNALYLAAHAIHESGYGTSNISLGKSNLFGFGSYDATPFIASFRFLSVKDNINYIAREMKATYLNPLSWKYKGAYLGFTTKDLSGKRIDANSEGMNFYYASDSNWGKAIASHMQKILPYNKADYTNAQINTTVPSRPSTPVGSDVFPANIQGVADSSIDLFTNKGDTTKIKTITMGTKFTLLEKSNDYWVKLSLTDGTTYWTNTIKFDVYARYISIQNLGRVTTDGLNVRMSPNAMVISQLKLNDYVSIVVNSDGTLAMDSTKTWYKIQLADGTYGWVTTTYIAQELK